MESIIWRRSVFDIRWIRYATCSSILYCPEDRFSPKNVVNNVVTINYKLEWAFINVYCPHSIYILAYSWIELEKKYSPQRNIRKVWHRSKGSRKYKSKHTASENNILIEGGCFIHFNYKIRCYLFLLFFL